MVVVVKSSAVVAAKIEVQTSAVQKIPLLATTMPSDTDSALSNEADAVGSHLLGGNTRQQTVAE